MAVIVFHNSSSNTGKRLRHTLEEAQLHCRFEYHETYDGLIATLACAENSRSVVVLQASDRQELEDLISVAEWFRDCLIIFILPDQEPETISKGHLLFPRFVAFEDGEVKHVAAVIEKMLASFSNYYLFG